jgi:hypothetical protein
MNSAPKGRTLRISRPLSHELDSSPVSAFVDGIPSLSRLPAIGQPNVVKLGLCQGGILGNSLLPVVPFKVEAASPARGRRTGARRQVRAHPLLEGSRAADSLMDLVVLPTVAVAPSRLSATRRSVRVSPARKGDHLLETRVLLATLTVQNTNSSGTGSLAKDITIANSQPGDTIIIPTSIGSQIVAPNSPLIVSANMTIEGDSSSFTQVYLNSAVVGHFFFEVTAGANVTFDDLYNGGGVKVDSGATVTSEDCKYTNCTTCLYVSAGATLTSMDSRLDTDLTGIDNEGGMVSSTFDTYTNLTVPLVDNQLGTGSLTLTSCSIQNTSQAVDATLSGATTATFKNVAFTGGNAGGDFNLNAASSATVMVTNSSLDNANLSGAANYLVGFNGPGTYTFTNNTAQNDVTTAPLFNIGGDANVAISGGMFYHDVTGTTSNQEPLIQAFAGTTLNMTGVKVQGGVGITSSPAVLVGGTGDFYANAFSNVGGLEFTSNLPAVVDYNTFNVVSGDAVAALGGNLTANGNAFLSVSQSAIVAGDAELSGDLFENEGAVAVDLEQSPSSTDTISGSVFALCPAGFLSAKNGALVFQANTASNNDITAVGVPQILLVNEASSFLGNNQIDGNTQTTNVISEVGGRLYLNGTTLNGDNSGVGNTPGVIRTAGATVPAPAAGAAIGDSGGTLTMFYNNILNYGGLAVSVENSGSLILSEGDTDEFGPDGFYFDASSTGTIDHLTLDAGVGIIDAGGPLTVDNSLITGNASSIPSNILGIDVTNANLTVNGTTFVNAVLYGQENGPVKVVVYGALFTNSSAVPVNLTFANRATGTISYGGFAADATGAVVVMGDATTAFTLNTSEVANNLITTPGDSQFAAAGGLTTTFNNDAFDGNTQPAYVVYVQGTLNINNTEVAVNKSGAPTSPIAGAITVVGPLKMFDVTDVFNTTIGLSNIFVSGGASSIISSSIAYDTEVGVPNFITLAATPGTTVAIDNSIFYYDDPILFTGAVTGKYSDVQGSLAAFPFSINAGPQFAPLTTGNPNLQVYANSPVVNTGDPSQGGTMGDDPNTVPNP